MRRFLTLALIPFAAWLLLATASCIYAPKRSLRPDAAPISRAPLDGTYCFSTVAEATRSYTGYPNETGTVSFLPTSEIREHSRVTVRREATGLAFDYIATDGTAKTARLAHEHRWENGRLIADVHYTNPFGFLRSRRKFIAYRLVTGELVLVDTRSDTGLSCGFLPMHHRQETVVVLKAC